MARFGPLAVVALLVCCLASPLSAQIGKGGGDRQMLRIDPDPSSTFQIGHLSNVFLTDTVTVPLYLHTAASVGYIECRFTWAGDDLTLLSAVPGPGVPDTATFTPAPSGIDTMVVTVQNVEEFTIESGDPIAYLTFEVKCFGWAETTNVGFTNYDNDNFYISANVPKAPLRDGSVIGSHWEDICGIIGSREDAYPGEQHISWTYDLYQEIPGKLLNARVQFDSSVLRFDSISPGPELLGGSVSAYADGDTVIVTFSPSNPFLPANVESSVFVLHFGFLNGNDDFTTFFELLDADRIDKCGWIRHPDAYEGGWVRVANHTATADIAELPAYPPAVTYDVPITMDSNLPINDYRLFVKFPVEDLAFAGIVGIAGFTAPSGGVSGPEDSLVQINASLNTNYLPEQLPAYVFKLRFTPRSTPQTVGTVFPLTFYTVPETKIRYFMDGTLGYRDAESTFFDGNIHIVEIPPPPPSCPTLYVWDGSAFAKDNTILAASDGAKAPKDVTDFYLVSKPVSTANGEVRFQIREDGRQVSEFRDFKLTIADHPASKPVAVTKDGEILTIGQPFAIAWAKDSRGADITNLIAARDEVLYSSGESGYFDVSFGKLTPEQIGHIALGSSSLPKDPKDKEGRLTADPGEDPHMGIDKKLKISVRTANGGWTLISTEDARLEPSRVSTLVDPELIDPARELVVRYSWEGSYSLDVLEFNSVVPFDGRVTEPRLVSIRHTKDGSLVSDAGAATTLRPGEAIDLVFDASSLPPTTSKMGRSYVFVATGRYETPGEPSSLPTAYALEANSPNPFNPSTLIRYALPYAARVEIMVFDVRGARVRTLVSAFQTAGAKSVMWDGRTDAGSSAATGVYFYRMTAPGFDQTRKMILIR